MIKSRDSRCGYDIEIEAAHRILTCEAELLLHGFFDKRDPESAPAGTF
jgi:hypothetical protein